MDSFLEDDQLVEYRETQAAELSEIMKSLKSWSLSDLPRYLTIQDGRTILSQSQRLIDRLEKELKEKENGHR